LNKTAPKETQTMNRFVKPLLSLALVLALIPVGLVLADAAPTPPCEGENVAGTVVAVDEATGVVTIDTGEGGLCMVTLADRDDEHPIVSLLGRYFGNVSADDLTDALAATQVWVVCDEDGGCVLADEGDEGAVPGQVSGVTENDDGTFTLEIQVEGEDDHVSMETDDADLANALSEALDALEVEWELGEGESGPVVIDAGARIAQLHEDGMGFGVIVKLYAIAAASQADCAAEAPEPTEDADPADPADEEPETCGVTVDELVEAFQGGMGVGQLFKEFGKPALLGVGHVRKAFQAAKEDVESDTEKTVANPGARACKAKKNGQERHNPRCRDDADTDIEPTGGEDTSAMPVVDNTTDTGNGNGDGNGHGNGGVNGHGNGNGGGNGDGGGNGGSNNGGGNGGGNHGVVPPTRR
jgi:hypothetical protein